MDPSDNSLSDYLEYTSIEQVNSVNLYPPAEMALVCLKLILSFIKFCSLVTKLWLICGF